MNIQELKDVLKDFNDYRQVLLMPNQDGESLYNIVGVGTVNHDSGSYFILEGEDAVEKECKMELDIEGGPWWHALLQEERNISEELYNVLNSSTDSYGYAANKTRAMKNYREMRGGEDASSDI